MDSIKIKAPAKVNLFLEVLGERPDGYAEIRTMMQAVSLYDELTVRKTDSGLSLSTDNPVISLGSSNTVAKAWGAFCSVFGKEFGIKVDIKKRIPIQAGLGGGSSDAASAIYALCRIYRINVKREILEAIGAAVGSDVPFFFGSGSSLATGRGEKILDCRLPLDYAILLVKPDYGMDTSIAYSLARKGLTYKKKKIKLINFELITKIEDICAPGNSLGAAFYAIHPEARDIPERLIRSGASCAALSGSGSSFFGIFPDVDAANTAKKGFVDMWSSVVHPVQLGYFDWSYDGV